MFFTRIINTHLIIKIFTLNFLTNALKNIKSIYNNKGVPNIFEYLSGYQIYLSFID